MDIIDKITELKHKKNAIILGHCYQQPEIDEVADYVGDSFYLSKMAAKTNADIIVFAGVHFMAQSAKLLNPDKKVLLPNQKSGCFMADMINIEQLRTFKAQHPGVPVVCYINSTAEIKAESDICCTSSNAIDVVRSFCKERKINEILFVPDTYLGKWVEHKLENIKVTTYNGFCPTHLRVRPQDIEEARRKYPNAKILAHPECHWEVCRLSDFVGSTKDIMEYAVKSRDKQFIIATEKGVSDRLTRDSKLYNWGKEFVLLKDDLVCKNMKWNSLEDILNSLENEEYEVEVEPEIFKKANLCVQRMLDIMKAGV